MLQPTPQPGSLLDGKSRRKRLGAIYDDAIAVLIHERVLEHVLNYSEQDLRRELGGWLIGTVDEQQRASIEIRHFLPAVHSRSRAASLAFTHETLAARDREVRRQFPGQQLLGWHHTHPGLGVFLSGYDLFVHKHYFAAPWHVALVVDPKQHEFAFFQWRHGEIVDCGFICIMDG